MNTLLARTAVLLPVVATMTAPTRAQGLGVTFDGELVMFSPLDGQAGVVADTGRKECQGMTWTADGRLLMFANQSPYTLIEVDPFTYTTTNLAWGGANNIRAIAAHPTDSDLVYLVNQDSAVSSELFVVDLANSNATLVGTLPFHSVVGLTFVPNGPLYGWDPFLGLVYIDPATAGGFDVNGVPDGSSDIQSLHWHDGNLFGMREDVYRFDLLTGGYSLDVAGPFGDIRGAEIIDGLCGQYVYCSTSPNSVGPGALINGSGSLAIADNGFDLNVIGCPPHKTVLFFFGSQKQAKPFMDGTLCVAGGLHRLRPTSTDNVGGATLKLDFGTPPPGGVQGVIEAGLTVNFQALYRDPGFNTGSNTSNALAVIFCQ